MTSGVGPMLSLFLLSNSLVAGPYGEGIPAPVAEAAFASLSAAAERNSERTLCLIVDGEDRSNDLNALAATTSATLVPSSECDYRQSSDRRETALMRSGELVEFLRLSSFERRAPDLVAIAHEYRAGTWTGTGSVLTLRFEDGS